MNDRQFGTFDWRKWIQISEREWRAFSRILLIAGGLGTLATGLAVLDNVSMQDLTVYKVFGSALMALFFAPATIAVFGIGPALFAVVWMRIFPFSCLGDESLLPNRRPRESSGSTNPQPPPGSTNST